MEPKGCARVHKDKAVRQGFLVQVDTDIPSVIHAEIEMVPVDGWLGLEDGILSFSPAVVSL